MAGLLPLELGVLKHRVVEEEAERVAMVRDLVLGQLYGAIEVVLHEQVFRVDQVKQLVDGLGRISRRRGLPMDPLEIKCALLEVQLVQHELGMDQPYRRSNLLVELLRHVLFLVCLWVDDGLWWPAGRKRPFLPNLLAVTRLFVGFMLVTGLDIAIQTFPLRKAMPLLEGQMEQLLRDGHA